MDFYRYDRRNGDNTLQRYVAEANAGNYEVLLSEYNALGTEYNNAAKRLNIIFPAAIVLVVLVVILIIILIVVLVRNGSGKDSKKNKYDNYDDDDDDDDYFNSVRPRRVNATLEKNEEGSHSEERELSSELRNDAAKPADDIDDIDGESTDDIEDLG